MAHSYARAALDLNSNSNVTLYTCPTGSETIVKSLIVSNDDTSNTCNITVTLVNSSSAIFSLFKDKQIAAKGTEDLLANSTLVLNAGDIIKVQAENADDLHVVLSYLSVT
jgi:hypothetical protein